MNLDTDLTSLSKINSEWITDLNIKHKTLKLLENNLGKLGYDYDFLDTRPKSRSKKEIIDKLDFIKIKNFCSAEDNIKRMRR